MKIKKTVSSNEYKTLNPNKLITLSTYRGKIGREEWRRGRTEGRKKEEGEEKNGEGRGQGREEGIKENDSSLALLVPD